MLIEDDERHSGPCAQETTSGQEEKEDDAAPADAEMTVGVDHTTWSRNFRPYINLKLTPNLNSNVIIIALSIQ